MVVFGADTVMFEDGDEFVEDVTTGEELTTLTLQDFSLNDFAGIGMVASGTGIVVSLLVLGLLSIIRTR